MMPTARVTRLLQMDACRLTLAIVVLAALAVRLYGLDWDDGADLHPDELFIAKIVLIDRIHLSWPPDVAQLLDPARSGLNPRSADPVSGQFREFAYGALPLWVTDATAWLLTRLTGHDWNGIDRAYLVGRALSALLSALTILPIAALGTAVAGRSVGLLAALFAALAPMSIQLAHFFTTDSWLTFFVTLCLAASAWSALRGGWWRFAAAGVLCGLAMATKGSVFTLAVPIALAIWLHMRRSTAVLGLPLPSVARNTLAATLGAAIGFFAFEPYALFEPAAYLQSLKTQADIASGRFDVPFSRVYVGTTPLLYQLEQFIRWGYGPVAGMLALAGLVLLARLVATGHIAATILTAWTLAYGTVILFSEMKFLRYLEPLAPVFATGAALTLAQLTGRLSAPRLRKAVAPVAVAGAVVWTAAFTSIYAHENPRLTATHWIFANVSPGATLTADYWDDALPRSRGFAYSPASFGLASLTLDLYRDLPPAQASAQLYRDLREADIIVQSSRRVAAAVRAAPWRYPVQGRYFDQLARGALGYQLAASIARSPHIASLRIDDSRADESFINYDHPQVAIYERPAPIARAAYDAVMSWALQRPWSPTRQPPPQPSILLDQPVGENPSVADARWSAPLTGQTPFAIAAWLVLLLVLLAVGIPIARALLPAFPDRGWGLARTLALAIAAYPLWLGASLQLVPFRAIWVVVAIAVTGVVAWRAWPRIGPPARPAFGGDRTWMHAEAAFWLVFLLFLAFRLITPDGWHPFWGGEKPMEFAQINAIGRSAYFPPYDPWFADGYLNYYYYGLYLMAFLCKAIGIPSEMGFNLALPTVMGLLASGGFSVAAALTRGLTRSARHAAVGGWAGVIALCVLGNLSAARGLVQGAAGVDPFLFWTWSGSRAIDDAITEFPYFSGLYADLHAHVVALPLTVAVIGLAYAIASDRASFRGALDPRAASVSARTVARILVIALLIGSLSATNIWDVPVYAALGVTAHFMATVEIVPWPRRLVACAAGSVVMLLSAWLLFLPFHAHFVALFGQVALVRDPTEPAQFFIHLGGLIAIVAIGLCVLLLSGTGEIKASLLTPFVPLALAVIGFVLALSYAGPTLIPLGPVLLGAGIVAPPYLAAWLIALERRSRCVRVAILAMASLALGLGAAAASLVLGRAVLALLLVLAASAFVGWLCLRPAAARFVCLLLVAACSTAAGVEVLVVADDLINTPAYRMNTVFKFYNQIWVLLALASAALAAAMIGVIARNRRQPTSATPNPLRLTLSRIGAVAAAAVLIAGLAYPLLATEPRLAQRFSPGTPSGSLNALAWMASGTVPVVGNTDATAIAYAGDLAAIGWLNQHIDGTPVIAEASIGPYRCNGSRISAATGLPTIIGWERHEQQQRYPDDLPARVADVRTLYTSSDGAEKTAILRRYNVAYVIVGDLERLYPVANNECSPAGSTDGIAAFDQMVGDTLEIAHSQDGTTIYRVLPVRVS